jgi:RNA-directed DNA polymerase
MRRLIDKSLRGLFPWASRLVMGFQYQDDGERFKRALETRLGDFKLNLHLGKTQLIEFGSFTRSNREQRGVGKPKSFDFLGFTHICSIHRDNGKFKLMRGPIKKKLRVKIKQIGKTLCSTGTNRYRN